MSSRLCCIAVIVSLVLAGTVDAQEKLPASVDRQLRKQAEEAIPASIDRLLRKQAECWNAGDLEGFLDAYWRSEQLTFSSGGETRRGFKATRERYLQTYSTREKMGRLTFSKLEVTPLGEDAAMTLGRWRLDRETDGQAEVLGGNFTLVLRRIDGHWRIVHDHTSRRPSADSPGGDSTPAANAG